MDPLLYDLFPALATDVQWVLERTQRALASLGDPHERYRTLHVGGTNGKGSVTAMLASIMRTAGHRTGCYTSPHLVSFSERIQVDGVALSEDSLKGYAAEVREVVATCGLTFFEAATVLALHAFAGEGVEVAALEVGLGGRLDATNVVHPEVSVVTNVELDHVDYLGDTLLEIAREKAGIMKGGVPFVTTESNQDVLELFRTVAEEVGAPMVCVTGEAIGDIEVRQDGTRFRVRTSLWGELEVITPLVGRHQALNAGLAVAVCERLPEALRPDTRALLQGLAEVGHRGRDEVRSSDGRTWLFDVAHNLAGMRSLADLVDRLDLPRPVVALVGILGDKDWRAMLPLVLDRCSQLVLTQPPTAPPGRRWVLADAERVAMAARGDGHADPPIHAIEDFRAAFEGAAAMAGQGTVLVTGSVHTVGPAMELLGVAPGE